MSFSETVRAELVRQSGEDRCCRVAELAAFYDFNGYLMGTDRTYLDFNCRTPLVARKILLLIRKVYYGISTRLFARRAALRRDQVFTVRIVHSESANMVHHELQSHQVSVQKRCCRRAYVRGSFLSHGSISNPQKNYHLEFCVAKTEVANRLWQVLQSLGLDPHASERKNVLLIYFKGGDSIAELLNIMGAHNALLQMENIRVVKGVRNSVNRLVNCETANVDKSIAAAVSQVKMIEQIQESLGLSNVSPKLAEVAQLRLDNPEASLTELGELARPRLSKSGVNYRMKKLQSIWESLNSKK